MTETRSGGEPEERLERTTEELDDRLHRLGDDIEDAQKRADDRRTEANPAEAAAGDWEDTRPEDATGEDPAGAGDTHDAVDDSDVDDSADDAPDRDDET